jgi:hypothetical protein
VSSYTGVYNCRTKDIIYIIDNWQRARLLIVILGSNERFGRCGITDYSYSKYGDTFQQRHHLKSFARWTFEFFLPILMNVVEKILERRLGQSKPRMGCRFYLPKATLYTRHSAMLQAAGVFITNRSLIRSRAKSSHCLPQYAARCIRSTLGIWRYRVGLKAMRACGRRRRPQGSQVLQK